MWYAAALIKFGLPTGKLEAASRGKRIYYSFRIIYLFSIHSCLANNTADSRPRFGSGNLDVHLGRQRLPLSYPLQSLEPVKGIDTAAHTSAIEAGGKTIAGIGTPLNRVYPKQNAALQEGIAQNYLLVSQVPVLRYSKQDYRRNRTFFLERNKTMSALAEATIIVEAGQTSGMLIQARAALHQRRKLFILEASFRNPALTWPHEFESMGAMRVKKYEHIRSILAHADRDR